MFTRNLLSISSGAAAALTISASLSAFALPPAMLAAPAVPTPAVMRPSVPVTTGIFTNGFVTPSVVVPFGFGSAQSFYEPYSDSEQTVIPQHQSMGSQLIQLPFHVVEPLIQEWNAPCRSRTQSRIIRGRSDVLHRNISF